QPRGQLAKGCFLVCSAPQSFFYGVLLPTRTHHPSRFAMRVTNSNLRTPQMTKKRSDQPNNDLCQFPFSDGRLCRMLRHPDYRNLCPFHAQAERQILESRQLGAQISTTSPGTSSPAPTSSTSSAKFSPPWPGTASPRKNPPPPPSPARSCSTPCPKSPAKPKSASPTATGSTWWTGVPI